MVRQMCASIAILCIAGAGVSGVRAQTCCAARAKTGTAKKAVRPARTSSAPVWEAKGSLLESCTCAVPCSCNFGEPPSPHSYCHAVFGYRLDKASWDGIDLSGLVVGGADGPKGGIGFVDARATATQRAALIQLGQAIFRQGGPADGTRTWLLVAIVHEISGNNLRLEYAGHGGFRAHLIVGRDGKTPVVVENNTVWPLPRSAKGKAEPLAYKDSIVGTIHGDGTNANYGKFAFTSGTAR